MNNSLKILFDEHEIISEAVQLAQDAKYLIGKDNEQFKLVIRELLIFFRIYADEYHHHKEEKILFPEMMKKNELLADGVIKEMFDNHAYFRELLQVVALDMEQQNFTGASSKIDEYSEALLDHIAVENEELFQSADSLFTDSELELLHYRFVDLDEDMGGTQKKDLAEKIRQLKINSIV